jgi:aminoglycoside phosphotransferase (APT) family kinase protein
MGDVRQNLVARVQPVGDALFPSYDVGRQFKVMTALHGTAVPVS